MPASDTTSRKSSPVTWVRTTSKALATDRIPWAPAAPASTIGDNIYRVTGGLKFHLNKVVSLNAGYEGVMYDLSPGTSLSGVRSRPTEQYITLGAGLTLTPNTVLKLAYQIGSLRRSGRRLLPDGRYQRDTPTSRRSRRAWASTSKSTCSPCKATRREERSLFQEIPADFRASGDFSLFRQIREHQERAIRRFWNCFRARCVRRE